MVFLLLIGLAVLPSYVWAFSSASSSAAPMIGIAGSILVNRAAYSFRLPYSGVTLFRTGSSRRGDILVGDKRDHSANSRIWGPIA